MDQVGKDCSPHDVVYFSQSAVHTQHFWIGKSDCWDLDDLHKPGKIIVHGNKVKQDKCIYNLVWAAAWLMQSVFLFQAVIIGIQAD